MNAKMLLMTYNLRLGDIVSFLREMWPFRIKASIKGRPFPIPEIGQALLSRGERAQRVRVIIWVRGKDEILFNEKMGVNVLG